MSDTLRDPSPYHDDLRLAHVLADSVEEITMSRFGAADLQVESKPDLTPVTEADREAERVIRENLKRARPRDAIKGEEFGTSGDADRLWIIDPIDGTKNYVRGVPVWATLIALVDAGTPVVGLVAAPALHRRWWAAQGTGAWTGRSLTSATSISVSKVDTLADASLSYSSFNGWAERGKDMDLFRLSKECWRSRAYGDFFSHMLVAQGSVDIAPEPELEDYDMAALVPIVTEAGGRFTGLDGRPGCWSGNGVSTNGLLHDEVLARVGDDSPAPSLIPGD
ncbi:histidinol phosphatase [Dermacoccus nishinomiyaensis]|uniref:Histidinol-phosphatase n=1 Tax=Dermacoccus nishinomiyaensis TaxID=1274 RepID=A0A075JJW2_9MICO|nr:histidinol-phosphatase [Dermacoccus nishinomiyaensis]AIF40348.1 histidinol phosphatase [Dermacoccus nishinomiyaensis]